MLTSPCPRAELGAGGNRPRWTERRVPSRHERRFRTSQATTARGGCGLDKSHGGRGSSSLRRHSWRVAGRRGDHPRTRRGQGSRDGGMGRSCRSNLERSSGGRPHLSVLGKAPHRRRDHLIEDVLIAATGIVHHLIVVTRNTRDFAVFPVETLNPFTTK